MKAFNFMKLATIPAIAPPIIAPYIGFFNLKLTPNRAGSVIPPR
jgi:hypothetical protein